MKKNRYFVGWIVVLALLLFQAPLQAQSKILVITPNKVLLTPGEGQQFRAQLFLSRGVPAPTNLITWKVAPDTLGTISSDGYFVAGGSAGTGKVIAMLAGPGGQKMHAEARVVISKKRFPLQLQIIPARAVAQPGDTLRFRVKAHNWSLMPVQPHLTYKWYVKPHRMGTISQRGVFVAGEHAGLVSVVVFTEFMGKRYKAEATVVITPEKSGAIAGVVTDETSGEPIVRAKVRAIHIGKIPWTIETRTDSLGQYLLKHLIPGYYVVFTRAKSYVAEFYDNVNFMRLATPVHVSGSDTTQGIDFALQHGAVLVGTVLSENDSIPLAGAQVEARLVVNSLVRFHAVSDSLGHFAVEGVPAGNYILLAEKSGFEREYYENTSDVKQAKILSVVTGDTLQNLNFTLDTKSAISGQVLSAKTGSPISGATVFARKLSPRPHGHWFRRTRTDQNGNYTLPVSAGNYVVGVSAKGFATQYFDGASKISDATPVTVAENQHTTGIHFSLSPLASISGTVTDQSTGQPIAKACVTAFSEIWHGKPYSVRTDENGNFEIPSVRPGIYVLTAKKKGYLPEFFEEANRLKDAKLVQVGLNESIENIDFTLSRGAILSGTVSVDSSSAPIPGAIVVAKMIGKPIDYEAFSKQDGSYQLKGLLPGKYIVKALARGYHRQFYLNQTVRDSATVLELAADDSLGQINFSLNAVTQQGGGISGLVLSEADSLPIEGAWVLAFPKRKGMPYISVTSADGSYNFSNLPGGTYFVLAWAKGFLGEFYDGVRNWKKATPVKVNVPDVVDDVNFSLAPVSEGTYSIAGRVFSHNEDQPLEHVFVYAHGRNGANGFAVSDEDGNYRISGIPAGHYCIFAARVGFWQQPADSTSGSDSLDVSVGSGENIENASITMAEVAFTAVQETDDASQPATYRLLQNYPNPFNPETQISYQLPQSGLVTVNVYNMLGQKVRTLIDKNQEAGVHFVRWAGRNDFGQPVSSGVYLVEIQVRRQGKTAFQSVKKMVLMR